MGGVGDRIEFDVESVGGVIALQHSVKVTAVATTGSVSTQIQGSHEKVIELDDVHAAEGIQGIVDSVAQVREWWSNRSRKASLQVTMYAKCVSAAIAMNPEEHLLG